MSKLLFAVALACATSAACRSADECRPAGATRCHGDVAQVCESTGEWTHVLDCRELGRSFGESWACTSTPYVTERGVEETHTCVPASEIPLVATGADQ
jgi:hypothetical protein